jgi:hypothetical protein
MTRSRTWLRRLRLALMLLLLAPIWLVMVFTGFPAPLPPWQRQRAPQTQSQPWQQRRQGPQHGPRLGGPSRLPR